MTESHVKRMHTPNCKYEDVEFKDPYGSPVRHWRKYLCSCPIPKNLRNPEWSGDPEHG